ncbi:hypothetical protein [Vibrio parahaemolyticus]|nr:hypothetical protein [Vibrio parahaemolyticus]
MRNQASSMITGIFDKKAYLQESPSDNARLKASSTITATQS